jgi:hypothetical protein
LRAFAGYSHFYEAGGISQGLATAGAAERRKARPPLVNELPVARVALELFIQRRAYPGLPPSRGVRIRMRKLGVVLG